VWGVIRAEVVKVNVTNRQTPVGEIVKARDAREMKQYKAIGRQNGREMGQRHPLQNK